VSFLEGGGQKDSFGSSNVFLRYALMVIVLLVHIGVFFDLVLAGLARLMSGD
jgi:hypothetical protein